MCAGHITFSIRKCLFVWQLCQLLVTRWGESGGGLLCSFLKMESALMILEKKKGPDCVHLGVTISIQNVVLLVSRRKTSKMFSCRTFFLVFLMKCLSMWLSSAKLSLPWKISGCVHALKHYSFCKILHLKFLAVITRHLYSGLMLWTAPETFRTLFIQVYSGIFKHILHC